MGKKKKWLALVTALCMVVPSISAFAANDPVEITGQGAFEFDSGASTDFYHIRVSTITEETYKFAIDPTGQLNKYDRTNYEQGKTVYFRQETASASLSNPDDTLSDGQLYVAEYNEDSNLTGLTAAVTVSGSDISLDDTTTYYVWVPGQPKPEGKYVELTEENLGDYFVVDDNGTTVTARADAKSGENVFDEQAYAKAYTALGTHNAADYVVVDGDGAITGLKEGAEDLYVKFVSGGDADYVKITADNMDDYLSYTAPTVKYTDTSDTVKVSNMSSTETKITATVTVTNPGSLNFVENSSAVTGDTEANVYMALTGQVNGGTTKTEVVKSDGDESSPVVSAKVELDLAGVDADTSYIAYQGDINPATGGHYYDRYLVPSVTYEEASFTITAEANSNSDDDTMAAWAAYNKYLEDAYNADRANPKIPKIDVVYSIKSVVDDETDIENVVWSDGNLWFALSESGGFTDHTKLTAASIKNTAGTYVAISDLSKITFNSAGWAVITWADLVAAGQNPASGDVEVKFTYDGVNYYVTSIGVEPS